MGSLLNKLRIYVEKMNQSPRNETRYSKNNGVRQDGRRGKEKDSLTIVKNGSGEQLQKDDVKTANTSRYMKRRPRLTVDEMNEAKEKIGKLEGELKIHKTVMVEHKTKMMMLEELIKRQCLVIKQNDDLYSYEELATGKLNTQTLWERIETQLGTMIDKKTNDDPCNEVSLVKIKHQFNQQHLQLQEHGQCIKRHEEQFEDQLARIEMMREMLDENSNKIGTECNVRHILEDHEKRLLALEDRMAVYEKQVERRLTEQHRLLIFTWLGLITTFVLCFAIVCSCCWFR